jgi:predicted chitinase
MLEKSALLAVMPHIPPAKVDVYHKNLAEAMSIGGITTAKRAASFLAQLAHESGELRYMEEIADGSAYEGRRDLGNIYQGDGKRFKGRGPIMLSGRSNYKNAGLALGIDLENHPEWAALPEYAFKIAVWFWNSKNLNAKADVYDFNGITKAVNGGYNGKAQRDAYYVHALYCLGIYGNNV